MIKFAKSHSLMVHSLLFSVWMFVLWKVCGMPSPGFAGRLLPAAWLFTALLSGRSSAGRWFMPFAALFTVAAWFWMIWEQILSGIPWRYWSDARRPLQQGIRPLIAGGAVRDQERKGIGSLRTCEKPSPGVRKAE